MTERQPEISTDFDWTDRERESYISGNYHQLADEDAAIDHALINSIAEHDVPILGELNSVLELGVGGVVRGPAFMAPLVRDEGIIHITDVSKNNVQATQRDMQRILQGDLGPWRLHQEHMTQCHPAWAGAFGRAAILGAYSTLNINELKPGMADAISLSYLIESKGHTDFEEWRRDLRLVANAAMRLIHLRQSDNSEAYRVGDKVHLAVPVTREMTEEQLDMLGFRIIGRHTAFASGKARQENDTHRYSGFSGIIAERV